VRSKSVQFMVNKFKQLSYGTFSENKTIPEDTEPLVFPMLRAGLNDEEIVNQFTTIAGAVTLIAFKNFVMNSLIHYCLNPFVLITGI